MNTKPKILIIGHGGTIAMTPSPKGLVATKSTGELLEMVPTLSDLADIELKQFDNIDSTNVNPNHWTSLIKEIAAQARNYDGIIITHGTDTMAYTATALSLGLGEGLKIPIILTGSQLPMGSFPTDARINLERAMFTLTEAIRKNVAEVMIVFADVVLRGNRSIKISESSFNAFESPAFPHLADLSATGVKFSPHTKIRNDDAELDIRPEFDDGIVTIELVPGLRPSLLRSIIENDECHGILLKSLGAGNVPNLEEYSVIPVIKYATSLNIPVILTTKFVGGVVLAGYYEVNQTALDAGAIATNDLTDVAAQVKFMWALAQGIRSSSELDRFINTDIVGEVTN